MADQYDILEDAVRDIYMRALWSHKVQEKQADIYNSRYNWLKIFDILFTVAAAIGVTSVFKFDCQWIKILAIVFSFISAFITFYLNAFDLIQLTRTHKETANKLLIIRNEIMGLLTSIKLKETAVKDIEEIYHTLIYKANGVYKEAPQTTDKALNKAEKALKVSKDNTFTDEEIDSYLPENLRKGKQL